MARGGWPDWADGWAKGKCPCGARLVTVDCYCGGHIACARTATTPCESSQSGRPS